MARAIISYSWLLQLLLERWTHGESVPPKDHRLEGQRQVWRRVKRRVSGKAQKEVWEMGRATAKDKWGQGKTCGHLLHQRGEGGEKDKEGTKSLEDG